MQEQSDRERAKAEEAAKANSLYNQERIDFGAIDDRSAAERDLDSESMFNPDDSVVLRNIFDGETVLYGHRMPKLDYRFGYNGVQYEATPGQVVRIPGSQAYLFVKHIVSLIYRRIENKPEMDMRTYPLSDKWVKEVVVRIDPSLAPEGIDRSVVHTMPDYSAEDASVAERNDGESLPGRLAGATSQGGGGEFELPAQNADEAPATDADLDKIPDFDPNKNGQVQFDEGGKPVDTSKEHAATTVSAPETPFAGAAESKTSKPRQAKK